MCGTIPWTSFSVFHFFFKWVTSYSTFPGEVTLFQEMDITTLGNWDTNSGWSPIFGRITQNISYNTYFSKGVSRGSCFLLLGTCRGFDDLSARDNNFIDIYNILKRLQSIRSSWWAFRLFLVIWLGNFLILFSLLLFLYKYWSTTTILVVSFADPWRFLLQGGIFSSSSPPLGD